MWKISADDYGVPSTVLTIRWRVGGTAEMQPEGAPRFLSEMVPTMSGDPGETTLRPVGHHAAIGGEQQTVRTHVVVDQGGPDHLV